MNGVGELLIFIINLFLGLTSLMLFVQAFTKYKTIKPRILSYSAIFFILFCMLKSCRDKGYHNAQLEQVGIYYLTNYPNCDSCYVELKEDMTYDLVRKDTVIKTSDWHFESGGDYWILYLDKDRYQLGSGDFEYKKYKLKYPRE
jgi:hypothetical protein